jgi:aquaporin Z
VLAAAFPDVGIGLAGVSLAFGLTVLTMAYAIGHISGCHLNPAVSIGLCVGKRFPAGDLLPYIIAQVAGAIVAAGVLAYIAAGNGTFVISDGFAANGYGEHSPGKYSLGAVFVSEFVLTFMFLIIILGSTDKRAAAGFAPIAIGLGLTLIHLIGIPVTNVSVNPARSTGPRGVCAGMGAGPALALLGRADRRRRRRRAGLQLARKSTRRFARLTGAPSPDLETARAAARPPSRVHRTPLPTHNQHRTPITLSLCVLPQEAYS